MTQEPALFSTPIRIYFEDTDTGGVVYYANYLKYLERCRSEWLRTLGYAQSALLGAAGMAFVVRSVNLEYRKPARLDDLVSVDLDVERFSRSQIFFRQRIRRATATGGWDELVKGTVQIVCVDCSDTTMKITSIPAALRTRLEARP